VTFSLTSEVQCDVLFNTEVQYALQIQPLNERLQHFSQCFADKYFTCLIHLRHVQHTATMPFDTWLLTFSRLRNGLGRKHEDCRHQHQSTNGKLCSPVAMMPIFNNQKTIKFLLLIIEHFCKTILTSDFNTSWQDDHEGKSNSSTAIVARISPITRLCDRQ